MPFPTNINKNHLLFAIDKIDKEGIPTDADSQYYDVVFNGKKYPPKVIVSYANIFANGVELDRNSFAGGLNTSCFKLLEQHGFKIEPKQNRTMNKVKIYKVAGSASSNAQRLFSPEGKYFYWNDKQFVNNILGDYVFVFDLNARKALYTKIGAKDITARFNSVSSTSAFNHDNNTYTVDDPDGRFNKFIRMDIITQLNIPPGWRWTTEIGVAETYDIWKPGINEINKRIEKIDDLEKIFSEGEAYEVLEDARKLLGGQQTIINPQRRERNVWFVCQGLTYKEEKGKKYLWAPQKDRAGNKKYFWDNMLKVKKGDIIFNYSDGLKAVSLAKSDGYINDNSDAISEWGKEGYRVDIAINELARSIGYKELRNKKDLFNKLLNNGESPFDSNGDVKQGYLFGFTKEAGRLVRDIYDDRFGNKEIDDFFDKVILKLNSAMQESKEIINHIHQYITSKGFQYQKDEIANFYLSLKAKPFVILAGISGTGKTQLPRKFAEAIGMDKKEQVIQVPVRPDWTDGSDLLGFTGLDNQFKPKDLTLAIQKAIATPDKPFFFLLDEMNLARVEHYFSDFLSVIETREWDKDGNVKTDPILRDEMILNAVNKENFQSLGWPQNLYLIGTVNMDETTHAFSRKVLDRANSIEMNDVNLIWMDELEEKKEKLENISNSFLATSFIESIDLSKENKDSIIKEMDILIEVNKILEKADLHFAYRVRDEVAFYLILNKEFDLMNANTAMDFQLVQKVLPRIHGSSERVQEVLVSLLNLLEGKDFKTNNFEYAFLDGKIDINNLKYKRASKKILFMLKRFDDDRFTSFWL